MLDSNAMGETMMITFAGMGVTFDSNYETQESLTLYISVPEHSYCKDVDGEEMAGKNLAKRFKNVLVKMGVKRLTVKSKIRKDEYWSEQNRQDAELACKKMLYGSQY